MAADSELRLSSTVALLLLRHCSVDTSSQFTRDLSSHLSSAQKERGEFDPDSTTCFDLLPTGVRFLLQVKPKKLHRPGGGNSHPDLADVCDASFPVRAAWFTAPRRMLETRVKGCPT